MTSVEQRYSVASNVNSRANSEKANMMQHYASRLSAPPATGFFDSEANKGDRLVLNKFTLYETKTVNY
jgi:hypothetical protein